MILSNAYDVINVMTRSADASYQRQTIIANNLANVDTPHYKRQDLAFENVLEQKLLHSGYKTLEEAVHKVDKNALRGIEYTDHPGFSYRLDENNVDVDTENVELASEQIRYQALIQSVTLDVAALKAVIK